MKCYCCGEEKSDGVQIDFLGETKFVCDECEILARRGQKPMTRVEYARPWALAIERKRGPVGCLYEAK
jgi:hypothetical protein